MSMPRGALRSATAAIAALAAACLAAAASGGAETAAKQAYIVDFHTGAVLLDKAGATPSRPA